MKRLEDGTEKSPPSLVVLSRCLEEQIRINRALIPRVAALREAFAVHISDHEHLPELAADAAREGVRHLSGRIDMSSQAMAKLGERVAQGLEEQDEIKRTLDRLSELFDRLEDVKRRVYRRIDMSSRTMADLDERLVTAERLVNQGLEEQDGIKRTLGQLPDRLEAAEQQIRDHDLAASAARKDMMRHLSREAEHFSRLMAKLDERLLTTERQTSQNLEEQANVNRTLGQLPELLDRLEAVERQNRTLLLKRRWWHFWKWGPTE